MFTPLLRGCAVVFTIVLICSGYGFGQTGPTAPATRRAATQPTRPQGERRGRDKQEYQSFAMTHPGDAGRGQRLFSDEQRLACGRCHTTDGKGGKAGPDLFAIGDKFGRRELVESVIAPSASIAVGYSTTIVRTRSGDVYDGVIKETTDDGGVALLGADGRLMRLRADEIAQRRTTDVSLMPEGLQGGLTLQEFADLTDYLASLKLPESVAANQRGMPATIDVLASPVALRPFHSDEHRFEHPVWFGPLPGVRGAFAVVEHESGKIWVLDKGSSGEAKSIFLETGKFQTGTRGLLGMVFHPKYSENHHYFIAKHLVQGGHFATHILEGEATPDGRRDSGRPLREILTLNEATNVHYGGGLAFGPDGYLYVGMGDSGPQQDPQGHAQNMGLVLGKMLRIDVDHPDSGKPYAVPADNPFVGRAGVLPEIWAYGLREPWRFSFDPLTSDLWVGDVGQDLYEEVDIVRRGENYGWNVYEGFEPFSNRYRREGEKYVPPVFAYNRKYGPSVTGGFVYRADPKSSFYGVYVFGDYESKRIFGLTQENRTLKTLRQIGTSPQRIVSFGRDDGGELYLVGYDGTIYRMGFAGAKFE